MAIVHERIRQLRKERGLTLNQVADYLGVTEATAQRYETGVGIKSIPLGSIKKYSELLNCTPEYLVGWDKNFESEENTSMDIGKRIRKRREALGLSQEELATMLGLSKKSIIKIEDNSENLSAPKIRNFAGALDCTVAYLLGTEEPTAEPAEQETPTNQRKLGKYFDRLSELNLTDSELDKVYEYAYFLINQRGKLNDN